MSTPFSDEQLARLSQYRRNRRAADSSVSEQAGNAFQPPQMFDFAQAPPSSTGGPKAVEWAQHFPAPPGGSGVANTSSVAAKVAMPAVPGEFTGTVSPRLSAPAHSTTAMLAAAAAVTPIPELGRPGGGGGKAAAQGAVPGDLASYILDLERQNHELRGHIQFLQDALLHGGSTEAAAAAIKGGDASLRKRDLGVTGDDKQAFLNDVLAQVEVVIQAHRNKMEVELQRYKSEAEHAKKALEALRESIHQEGMDLTLTPAVTLMETRFLEARKSVDPSANGGAESVAPLPDDVKQLLAVLSSDILTRLSTVQEGDDVSQLVRDAVSTSFRALVAHFSNQMVECSKGHQEMVDALKKDYATAKDDLRAQLAASEQQRVQLVRKYDLELQALRDELHAFYVATTQSDVQASVQERALDEYTSMLVEARAESAALRTQLEEEKSHSAQVCLKLKAALQRRNSEFERALVGKAEEVMASQQRTIEELQHQLRHIHDEARRTNHVDQASQTIEHGGSAAATGAAMTLSAGKFVSNLIMSSSMDALAHSNNLSSVVPPTPIPKSAIKALNASSSLLATTPRNHTEAFETDVLRKTRELLSKYGHAAVGSSALRLSSANTP